MKYRVLDKDEIVEPGDEVEVSGGNLGAEAKWVPAEAIGTAAPDPSVPAHRVYRRLVGTGLFRRAIYGDRTEPDEMMVRVWGATPWVVNARTGNISNNGRYRDVMEWCRENFGEETTFQNGHQGNWQRGGATVYGWTWMGFATEEMMEKFWDAWGDDIPF